jgi:hypothetical protein
MIYHCGIVSQGIFLGRHVTENLIAALTRPLFPDTHFFDASGKVAPKPVWA